MRTAGHPQGVRWRGRRGRYGEEGDPECGKESLHVMYDYNSKRGPRMRRGVTGDGQLKTLVRQSRVGAGMRWWGD